MVRRAIFMVAGFTALALGLLGVVLPLLPTTPFVLVAAWCFARSSARFHRVLTEHKLFGPLIRDWERHGVIPLRIKCLSSTMMIVMVSYPLFFREFAGWLKFAVVLTVLFALWYIWTRPSQPAAVSESSL